MQHEVVRKQRLLNENGIVAEPGWARHPVWVYDRRDIKASPLRIKEWDYYLVMNERSAAAFTISDLGYAGLVSVSLIDLRGDSPIFAGQRKDQPIKPMEKTQTVLTPFPLGRMGLRAVSSSGSVVYGNSRVRIKYDAEPGRRRVRCIFKNFMDGKDLRADIRMLCPDMESMCIATPWRQDPKAFYYNQKINCMPAGGTVTAGGNSIHFHPKKDMAMLDWGRGVWTYDNTWYWSSASGLIGGETFGFNLGYGFGNTDAATENMLFYGGRAHKLRQVTFQIPRKNGKDDFMSPWRITSDNGRFEAVFHPDLDRASNTQIGPLGSDQHQVFGYFTGTATLDDGRVLHLDRFFGFAEKVRNKW